MIAIAGHIVIRFLLNAKMNKHVIGDGMEVQLQRVFLVLNPSKNIDSLMLTL
jgi:hypothetical protein